MGDQTPVLHPCLRTVGSVSSFVALGSPQQLSSFENTRNEHLGPWYEETGGCGLMKS